MILADHQIKKAIEDGFLIMDPVPLEDQYGPTTVDLHIGDDLQRFDPKLFETPALDVRIRLDALSPPDLRPYMERVKPESDGSYILKPRELVLVTTLEWIELPPHGRLAARVDGRSRFARTGLLVHLTAPTIHNTFRGKITLELINLGPLPLVVVANRTRLCQLVFERVETEPGRSLESPFQDQNTPFGR